MAQLSISTTIARSADDVWQLVSDFGAIHRWHPAVADCKVDTTGKGEIRTCTLQGGAQLVEELDSLDDNTRTLSYSIVDPSTMAEDPLPLAEYQAKMWVEPRGAERCELFWSCTFTPAGSATEADVQGMIEQNYRTGFEGLKRFYGG